MLQQNRNAGELQLNAADLACARQLLESHQASKDPGPMYDFLISKEDRYATLANGVARGNSIAGGMAIHYLESVAASHNQPITEGQLNDIRFAMARGYLDMQQRRLDDSPGTIYGDINHEQAALFHNRIFNEFGLPPKAWTLTPVFKAIDEKSRPVYWEQVLNAAGKPVEELKLSVDTYQKMALSSKLAPDEIQKSSREWFARVDSPSGYWALGKSATSQLFTPPDETPIAIPQCNIDINITPTPQATQRITDEDQAQRDVTNGYLVNKPTHSLSFTDDSLDNTDFTSVQMGSIASGGIRPGEIQLDPNIQPSRYLSEYYLERPRYILPESGLFDAATLNGLSAQTTINTYVDPLLLDLTGSGVKMVGLREGVLFDTDNSGSLKRTGWAGRYTGMLVIDNGSGKIENISQMYSEYYAGAAGIEGQPGEKRYQDGFAALASEDSDGNGVIDKRDPIWHKLRIWHDRSRNGIVDPGELKSLDSWRISEIHVKASAASHDDRHGNRVIARSIFMMDGRRREVLAVNFVSSPVSNTILKRDDNGAFIRSVSEEVATTAYIQLENKKASLSADELAVNHLYGGNQDDTLIASAAGSWLVGRGGSNTYKGGTGNDVFVISASDMPSHIQGNGGRDTVLISGDKGVALNMARSGITLAQGGDGDDVIVSGGDSGVFMKGGNGNSTLVGGGGSDVLSGGRGKNCIVGGSGKAVIYAGPQGDTIYASEQGSIIHAGGGADRIYGNKHNDVIVAGQGDALIDGGGGINVVALHGSYADYTLTRTESGYQVKDKVAGRDGTLTLKNIQKLNFADISAVELGIKTIIPLNDILIYGNGSPISRFQNTNIPAQAVLGNDFRFNTEAQLVIANVSDAIGGTVQLKDEGDVLFIPDSTFTGVMSFNYEVKSVEGDSALSVLDLSSGESAIMRATVVMRSADIPHDPLFAQQTYLNEINVIPVWLDYTGRGVRIGQFEPGGEFATAPEIFDIQHPDLVANVDPHWLATQKKTGELPDEISNHASMVAGVMVAAKNQVGGVGVAYEARLGGHYLSNDGADLTTLGKMSSYDVVNHSWGFKHEFAISNLSSGMINLANTLNLTLHYAAANGRGGLGTIIVTTGGNQRKQGGSTQGSLMSNSRFAIQVAAMNSKADLSTLQANTTPFSNRGASLLVSAPGSHILSSSQQITAERGAVFGAQYSRQQGTSFAAPIVSGIAALMLQANPNLGYRDVQQILALSARRVNDPSTQWRTNSAKNWNGGGMHVSHDYGFGAVDARAAVRLAESWTLQKTDANQQVSTASHKFSTGISLLGGMTRAASLFLRGDLDVEQVEVDFSAHVGRLGDLTLTLTSPNGTKSILLDRTGKKAASSSSQEDTGSQISGDFNHTFMSTFQRGENSGGMWRLVVKSAENGLPVELKNWSIRLFGNPVSRDDTYFYTDEFATLVASSPTRATLNDAIDGVAGGRNTLNMAAISGDVRVNLLRGEASLGGEPLTLHSPGLIHNLISGDGNDILTAGSESSLLDGGRGLNLLEGGSGKEVFVVRKRANGVDWIANFDADKKEVIQLVGVAERGFGDLQLKQVGKDVRVQLADNQHIFIKERQVAALKDHHFHFEDTFAPPAGYFNSSIRIDNPTLKKPIVLDKLAEPKQAGIMLNGGGGGVSLSFVDNKMAASLVGKVYQRENAKPALFVVMPQEGRSEYGNAVRGFRHGIDKIDLSAVAIRHFSELTLTKRRSMVINGLALIQGVDIKSAAQGPEGKNIEFAYLDGLDVEHLDAGDFIFADTEVMLSDSPLGNNDIGQLINITPDFDHSARDYETVFSPPKVPQLLTHTLTASPC
ncbi:putative serine protease [Yersinia mollaretii]|uniref:S8 family serine peptidase n=1 Tax=Yersinia mollaretii TaxID=33060 RepID=UPI0005E40B2C|nr:S8 family serine peptidase [Yersinia mollaretii]CNK03077.1 putative serine protease [Yersinia mollaretii]